MKKAVIKVGSSSIVKSDGKLNKEFLCELVRQISLLKKQGIEVCVVSSGAIAVGTQKLNLKERPSDITKRQALSAVGQLKLMHVYDELFEIFGMTCAQILVNHDDFGIRNRVTHLLNTLEELSHYGAVPIINENDALSVDEIKVGDNDTLSAMTALLFEADLLILLTDVDGLYTANPVKSNDAKLIKKVDKIDKNIYAYCEGSSSSVGTGGMITKIKAAEIANYGGINMLIINSKRIGEISEVYEREISGTMFCAASQNNLKKCWIAFFSPISGKIIVDEGAGEAIIQRKSLLMCGIKSVENEFNGGSCVTVENEKGKTIAKGIVNLSAKELIADIGSGKVHKNKVVIHADNIAIL